MAQEVSQQVHASIEKERAELSKADPNFAPISLDHEVDLTLGQRVSTPNPGQIAELQELIDMQLPGDVQAELDRRMEGQMSSEMATMDDGAATAQAELAATQESEIRAAQRETSGLAEDAQREQQRQIESSQAAVDKERGRVLAEQDEAIKKIDAEIAEQQDSAASPFSRKTKKKQAEIDKSFSARPIKSTANDLLQQSKAARSREKEADRGWLGAIGDAVGDFFSSIANAISGIFKALSEE